MPRLLGLADSREREWQNLQSRQRSERAGHVRRRSITVGCKPRSGVFHKKRPVDDHRVDYRCKLGSWPELQTGSDFLSGADPILIACGLAHGYTVVSHEVHVPGQRSKVKIPAVCQALNVSCVTTFEMLAKEKVVFD